MSVSHSVFCCGFGNTQWVAALGVVLLSGAATQTEHTVPRHSNVFSPRKWRQLCKADTAVKTRWQEQNVNLPSRRPKQRSGVRGAPCRAGKEGIDPGTCG